MAMSRGEVPEVSSIVQRGLDLGRELGSRTIMFHQAVADRIGLNATDMKCLDLARLSAGPLTAGKLAEVTGLTSGAITGVIDRLEKAGLARRIRDPQDRRKVLVEAELGPMQHLIPIYQSLGRGMAEICMRYDEQQLAVIHGFLEQAITVLKEHTERLRDEAARDAGRAADSSSAAALRT